MKFWMVYCALLFTLVAGEKTICLNMIVKNESRVIERCLSSVKDRIDHWVIVDTGSQDGTQEVIRNFLKEIPGELHERPWVNFGHNRNEALQLAKGKSDYILFIDADEVLEGAISKKELKEDVYLVQVITSKNPLLTFQRALLIKDSLEWAWKGVLHERLDFSGRRSSGLLPDLFLSAVAKDGHRAQDPEKYLKDAAVLEKALLEDPKNEDYMFYLAQSYCSAQRPELALKTFQKRAEMEGWDEHVFWAKYSIGVLQQELGKSSEEFLQSFSDAFAYRPTRMEPLFRLAQHYYTEKKYWLGYILAQFGAKIPVPTDFVYVEQWVYSYGMLAVWANCAFELGKYKEAAALYEKIAAISGIPEEVRKQARDTQMVAYTRLTQKSS